MRAATYLRFSCPDQADGFSIDAQRHATHGFIQQRGWTWVTDYVDEAYSAKADSERPAFQRLLADARLRQFDVVVVDKVDRFYRHLRGLLTTLDELQVHNVALVSVKENLDFATPWGKIALTLLGILAEVYIDNLRQETRKGLRARARSGKWNGSIPFGYCRGNCSACTDPNGPEYCPYAGQPDHGDGEHLIAHPIESVVVQQAFAWYTTGDYSDAQIAEMLNRAPYQLPDGTSVPYRTKGKPGQQPGVLSNDAIRTILVRRFYTGLVPYYGVDEVTGRKRRRDDAATWHPGQHPPLVDTELFEAVQAIRAQAQHRQRTPEGTNPIAAHPLSGLLVCARCGKHFRATTTSTGYRYYRDATQIERTSDCTQPPVKAEDIEAQVLEFMLDCQQGLPADWREQLEARWTAAAPDAAQQVVQAKERLARAAELYLVGLIDQSKLQEQQMAYQLALTHLRPQEYSVIISLGQTLERFNALWAAASLTTKNGLLRPVLEAALIDNKSLVGLQSTVAFFPILAICHCGSDGTRSTSDNIRSIDGVLLLPPDIAASGKRT